MVAGLPSGVPLIARLPAIYQDDAFAQRFVAAFDDALAPALATLDALPAYVDPRLAPPDFLAWVAEWVGIEVDDAWPIELTREIVSGAALLHRRRGTVPGLVDAVRLALGLGPSQLQSSSTTVEVQDSGGTTWSTTPGAAVPGSSRPNVTVRVTVPMSVKVDRRRVERFVSAVKPAHVPHTVVVVVVDAQEDPC